MNNENHYYIEGYSIKNGPYVLANGVLKNNIENTQDINDLESDLTAIEINKMMSLKIFNEFSINTIKTIHEEFLKYILGTGNSDE